MDQSSFSLRPATTEDLESVLKLERQVHPMPWAEEHFRAELTKPYSHFLVLTDDETDTKVAGYVVCWVLFDECQIMNIAVDLPYRGLGFAKKMVQKAVLLASQKGVSRVTLEVRKSNLPAIQLYQRLQFVITQIRKKFYSDGEDAYHMRLSLAEDPIQF